MIQDSTDMLQRGIQLPVDAPQLAPFTNLTTHVEPEPRFRFLYGDHSGALRHLHIVGHTALG